MKFMEKQECSTIAKERMKILFREADKAFDKNPSLANRYVELARKIAMRTKTRMPKRFRRKFCKHCHSYFKHGKNCRVRTSKNNVIYYCSSCNQYTRIPFVKEKKNRI